MLTTSCRKVDYVSQIECEYVEVTNPVGGFIDSIEMEIMLNCYEDRILDVNLVKENLIGTWKLVGYGAGWFPSVQHPCSILEISTDEVIHNFRNNTIDTTMTHSWDIIDNNSGLLRFEAEPDLLHSIGINIFCDKYMYGNFTPSDGDMHLYEKQ